MTLKEESSCFPCFGSVLYPYSTAFWIRIQIIINFKNVKLPNNYCQTNKEHYSFLRYRYICQVAPYNKKLGTGTVLSNQPILLKNNS